jgi:hypothetical protein
MLVRCPHGVLARALAHVDNTHDDVPWCVTLRAPVRLNSLDAEIMLSRETIACVGMRGARAGTPLPVGWHPAEGESFPRFAGMLWTEGETLCTSWLRLEGVYDETPSSARIAQRGERAIGQRIAHATAKAFLDEVAGSVERLRATGWSQRAEHRDAECG